MARNGADGPAGAAQGGPGGPGGPGGADGTASGPARLDDLVRSAAAQVPDRPALVVPAPDGAEPEVVTWAALDARVDDAARRLLALGLGQGDRVGLRLGNVPAFPAAYFGALRAGLVAVPVNPGYTLPELVHVLGTASARVLVTATGAGDGDALRAALPDLAHVLEVAGDGVLPGDPPAPDAPLPGGRGGEDLAVLLFTSGTSGRPRGAMLSHRALLADLEQAGRLDPPVVAPDDVVLLVLPLFHVYGLNAALGMVAGAGATGVLVDRFDAATAAAQVRRHAVTCVVGAPPMYVAWSRLDDLREDFAGVRVALSGAAPLPAPAAARFTDLTGLRVHEGYGLTETAPVVTSTLVARPPGAGEPAAGSVGRPLPGVEVRLLDPAGAEVDEGDPGEVVVRGDNLFSGYWPDGEGGPDAEGWWPTGDIAYADPSGDLHLVDRRRELVLVNGFNVYPREVEEVLLTAPGVLEAAVLGVPDPDTGEAVRALVVARPGAHLEPAALLEHCRRSLARFKCPTSVQVVPDLPHSATGKVSKGRLRELAG